MQTPNIAFIGAGNMANSLINGMLSDGFIAAQLRCADPVAAQRGRLAALGVQVFEDNNSAIADAELIVLAVKPQVMAEVVATLTGLRTEQLLVSIAAGITIDKLQGWCANEQPIVRCMPNTPALLGAGITGLYANASVQTEQAQMAERVLSAVGTALWVDTEIQLDAVTAVSGSGPAYFFYLMQWMIEAGKELGLDAELATALTVQTAYGAALMANEDAADVATLRQNVTSPGGTTERALQILDQAGVDKSIVNALKGAAERAHDLGK